MVRILVFCINAQDRLEFTKGLSAADEPDMWVQSLDGQQELWIDVGEPSLERIKKASQIASTDHAILRHHFRKFGFYRNRTGRVRAFLGVIMKEVIKASNHY